MADIRCEVEGCDASVASGDAIHRTSPKGGPFRGKCTKHFRQTGQEPDAVAVLIEEHNLGADREEPGQ